MPRPIDSRPLTDRQAGTDTPQGAVIRSILADAGLLPGLSMDAVFDRIETEARIWR